MGQRANLIVKRNSRWRLHYDHWCANRLDAELFWGPELARQFIEQREAGGDSCWLDEVWCEGAAVLDFDAHLLLFFGGEDIMWDIPLRRAHLSLMEQLWPGWEIRWAHEGIVTIGAYVGMPTEAFLSDREPEPEQRFRVETGYPEENRTLLTNTSYGVSSVRRVAGDEESLQLGPAALDVLSEVEGTHRLAWQGEMPTGGLHVDFDRKTIGFWWSQPTPAILERAAAAWSGWEVSWFHDRFEAHIERSGLDILLPEKPLAELQAARIESLRHRCHSEARNLAREIGPRIGAERINPASDEARGSVGDEAEKLRILTRLSRLVPKRSN